MSSQPIRRDVVSYVRRSARMSASQQRAWEAHRRRWVIDIERGERSTSVGPSAGVDWVAGFGRSGPLIAEIGCGTGDSLVPMAAARPASNVIAFEVFEPAVAGTLSRLAREGVDNVRLIVADAAQALATLLAPGSLSELWLYFPDPWPKVRHHKRRLLDPAFAALAASRLRPGGLWRLATDWADYADAMRAVLDAEPQLVAVPDAGRGDRPITRFERRGLAAGRTITELSYARRT